MRSEISRNNHYISKMYLKEWECESGKVWVYNLLVSNKNIPIWNKEAIKNVCTYDSMFVRFSNGIEIDDIEKMFSEKYETPANEPLNRAKKGEKLSIEDWNAIIDFLVCNLIRMPSTLLKILNIDKNEFSKIFEEECEEFGKKLSSMTKNKFQNNNNENKDDLSYASLFPLNVTIEKNNLLKIETYTGKQFYLSMAMKLLDFVSSIFHSNKWGIITVDDEIDLPTSDNPIIFLEYLNGNNYRLNCSWNQKNVFILFPISSKKIIYTRVGKKVQPRYYAHKEQSNFMKKIIVENSYMKVISKNVDNELINYKKRSVSKKNYNEYHLMWENFQKDYLTKEQKYIR